MTIRLPQKRLWRFALVAGFTATISIIDHVVTNAPHLVQFTDMLFGLYFLFFIWHPVPVFMVFALSAWWIFDKRQGSVPLALYFGALLLMFALSIHGHTQRAQSQIEDERFRQEMEEHLEGFDRQTKFPVYEEERGKHL